MVSRALEAAGALQQAGISAAVLEVHTIKPLDVEAILNAPRATGALVTAEEHSLLGGLGGAVAESVVDSFPVPVVRLGLADCFAETGPYHAILDRFGMSVQHILEAAKRAVKMKG
jgi:transketolase